MTESTPANCPEFSVVIPAYNASRYLAATLASIASQRGVNLEIIVVDDCSKDSTADLTRAWADTDPRIRYLKTPQNCGGPAGPRNLGIQHARGRWVALCDSDDLWHPDKLRMQKEVMVTQGVTMSCTAIEDFPDGQSAEYILNRSWPGEQPEHRAVSYRSMLIKNRMATSSVVAEKSLFLAHAFNVDRGLIAVEDYDLWLRLLELPGHQIVRLKAPLVAYRRVGQSLSANKWKLSIKAMRVVRRASERRGWRAWFPMAMPAIYLGYAATAVYWRLLRGKM